MTRLWQAGRDGGAGASLTIIRLDGTGLPSGSQSGDSEHDSEIEIGDE